MADKYSCFLHPKKEYSLKELTDACPDCGRTYGFPLTELPTQIGRYEIAKPAGRGFYGATYRATQKPFNRNVAVKVIPKDIYTFFGKDFNKECQEHYSLAQNTEHLAQIDDCFDADVEFGNLLIPCHVAVMRWVDGITLSDLLIREEPIEATVIAQIALDLLSLLAELQRGGKRHNDLHNKNLVIEINHDAPPRKDRIHSEIRAIAVDFGSIADASLSGDSRIGDLRNVGTHIEELTQKILRQTASESDLNWRLAFALDQTARSLARDPISQRISFSDLHNQIASLAVYRAQTPVWYSSLELKSFSEHYNALTIESAYVPNLLVLPHPTWFDSIKAPGPQVISGMRGCGKTMLLKSLDFHARAFGNGKTAAKDVIGKIETDKFVGLFLACAKLLDQANRRTGNLHVRLLLGYALAVIRVAQHLRDIDASVVDPQFPTYISESLRQCISPFDDSTEVGSEYKLEEMLVRLQLRLGQEDFLTLRSSPAEVFPIFAGVLEKIAPTIFGQSHVLFLLDDVSTRFISEEAIAELMSALLFSNEKCSFKFTTEAQTLELVLKSPGRIERASQGRDYTVFNLGAEVSRLIRGKGKEGKQFIADILHRRHRFYLHHPSVEPARVLGDQRLVDIAANIGKAFESPDIRKRIYWGLSALTSLCVGDVGEVIRLYEDILKQAKPGEYPVQPELQHKCFQHICTSALHDINRRNPKFKNHALGFANAAHKLLRQSLGGEGGVQKRVRQYAQVYVSISTGDQEWIYTEIRDLLDAGIYVLDAATVAPRTKRVNADPIQQFILTYRKLYGVSTLIGLAYRDRFELSGKDLESWLREPEKAEDVFIRNQGLAEEGGEASGEDESGVTEVRSPAPDAVVAEKAQQIELWDQPVKPEVKKDEVNDHAGRDALGISVSELSLDEIGDRGLLIAGLGFEERCEGSLVRLLEKARFGRGVLVRFPEEGRSDAIGRLFERHHIDSETIQADRVSAWSLENDAEDALVDVSGLAKPAIFHFCRHVLEKRKLLYVCHTQATEYFPSDADIEPVIKAHNEEDTASLLDSVATLFKGEDKPYRCLPLLADQADESRQRALITFSSAKHERLLALLDERFYDFVGIGYSSAKNGRGRISELAARFAVRNINGAVCYGISTVDLAANLAFLANLFFDLYHKSGDNVEIGLTGSKISGVAAAILAARWKVSQAWYVKPERFNPDRFTTGVGISRVYRIAIEDSPVPSTTTQQTSRLAG
jgi:hypothetical protein